jgi:predicted nuclease with RNAse H fold
VDLASRPERTGASLISWGTDGARIQWAKTGLDDGDLLEAARGADVVGIDAPFGWPDAFVEAVHAHWGGRGWPVSRWDDEHKRRLRYRRTDERVREICGRWPLSPSSDLIGVVALRCAGLLAALGVTDRAGDGRVFEIYPAAARAAWALDSSAKRRGRSCRQQLEALCRRAPWLEWDEPARAVAATSRDVLDAVVAALAARAAALGLTLRPDDCDRALARSEGWIAVPLTGSLEALISGELGPQDVPLHLAPHGSPDVARSAPPKRGRCDLRLRASAWYDAARSTAGIGLVALDKDAGERSELRYAETYAEVPSRHMHALAVLRAIEVARERDCHAVVVEIDTIVPAALRRRGRQREPDSVYARIDEARRPPPSIVVRHRPARKNRAARDLARQAANHGDPVVRRDLAWHARPRPLGELEIEDAAWTDEAPDAEEVLGCDVQDEIPF